MKKSILLRLYALPLRAHLFMMALLLALPAVALIIQSGMTQHAEALRKGFSEARRLASGIAKEQYNLTGNVEQLLMVLEQIPEIGRHDAAATHAILSAILQKNPYYGNIIVADRHGEVWASGLPMTTSFSVKQRRSFQQAVKTGRFSSGDFVVGQISRKPTIGFGYPISDANGDVAGAILVNIDFEQFNELLPVNDLPEGSSFSIIDRNGLIVDRNLDRDKYVGTKLREDVFLRMKNGPAKAVFVAGDLTDDKRIVAYRKMQLHDEQAPYLYVRTAFPLEKVMGEARRALIINIAILSSLLLAALLSVIFLGNFFFVKRIDRLQQAAQRLAEGDLSARVSDTAEGGEIGRLGEVFNDMAGKLSARQATLVRNELDLFELNQSLIRRVEKETERRVHHERLLARHARLVAMGEMIGAIAHQWRQPLATLGATIQSIRMAWEHDCLDEPFLKQAEEDAQKQLYYMSDTIEDFRNFFTPEKITEKFDVRDKVSEVIMLVSHQFAHSGVTLQTVDLAEGEQLHVRGYQNEFKQSLLNLVSNSFDAVADKGSRRPGSAGATEDGGMVTIVTAGADDKVVIEVRDNGCGIAPEHADKVFDPYFTTKTGDKGTGIGLYMTKLIVEQSMGGSIRFTSGPEGTLFRIELARDDSGDEADHG
jgi:C4-dicarboxylate-specific signal transduction histidine kinase